MERQARRRRGGEAQAGEREKEKAGQQSSNGRPQNHGDYYQQMIGAKRGRRRRAGGEVKSSALKGHSEEQLHQSGHALSRLRGRAGRLQGASCVAASNLPAQKYTLLSAILAVFVSKTVRFVLLRPIQENVASRTIDRDRVGEGCTPGLHTVVAPAVPRRDSGRPDNCSLG